MKKFVTLLILILLFTGCAQEAPTSDEIAQKAAEIVIGSSTPVPTQDANAIAQAAADILKEEFKVGDRISYNEGKSFTYPLSGVAPENAKEYALVTEYYLEITEVNSFENAKYDQTTDANGNVSYYFYDNKAQMVLKGTVDAKYAGKTLRCWNFANSAIIQSDGSFIFISEVQNVQKDFVLNSPITIIVY